jgi:hypothetical protein
MTDDLDGPAKNITLMLCRAPQFLRGVCPPGTSDWDALDTTQAVHPMTVR